MAKKSMVLKQQAKPPFVLTTAARSAAVPTLTCATTAFAVSASASWLTRARFRAFARHPGKDASKGTPVWGAFFRFLPRGTLSPLDTPPVPEKPRAITPSRTRPRRRGAGSGIKVRQSWTFIGNFTRPVPALARRNAAGSSARNFFTFLKKRLARYAWNSVY